MEPLAQLSTEITNGQIKLILTPSHATQLVSDWSKFSRKLSPFKLFLSLFCPALPIWSLPLYLKVSRMASMPVASSGKGRRVLVCPLKRIPPAAAAFHCAAIDREGPRRPEKANRTASLYIVAFPSIAKKGKTFSSDDSRSVIVTACYYYIILMAELAGPQYDPACLSALNVCDVMCYGSGSRK